MKREAPRTRHASLRMKKRRTAVPPSLFPLLQSHAVSSTVHLSIMPIADDSLSIHTAVDDMSNFSNDLTNTAADNEDDDNDDEIRIDQLNPVATFSPTDSVRTQTSRNISVRERAANNLKRNIPADMPVHKRNRTPNLHLLKYFPQSIMSITNSGLHNLTLPQYHLSPIPRHLSAIETLVLSLGPQFIFTPPCLTTSEIDTVCHDYEHRIRRKYYFATNPSKNSTNTALDKLMRTKSMWVPPRASACIESYLSHVKLSMHNAVANPSTMNRNKKHCNHVHNNAFKTKMVRNLILRTIRNLLNDNSILFKKCDKNLGISVVPRIWYEQQALAQLTDINTYTPIDDDTIPTMSTLFDKLRAIINGHNLPIDVKNFLFRTELTCDNPSTTPVQLSKFYLLPKIHKTPISTRPIVASMASCTFTTSKYIDYILQPVMRSIPRIMRSSTDLLRHLNITSFPCDCVLLTADVTSLYPSIDLADGLSKLRLAIDMYNLKHCGNIDSVLVVKLCSWVLYNNYIEFGNSAWLQIRGTAMGTPMAVVFANLYLAMLEDTAFKLYYEINPATLGNSILLFVRYIDDIFAVLSTNTHCTTLLHLLDHMHPTISITYCISDTTVDFLDMSIHKGSLFPLTTLLDTKPYQKPMNAYLYIPMSSYHKPAVFKGFIQSEIRRYCIISTIAKDATDLCTLFRSRLIARGYPPEFLDDVLSKIYCRRDELFPPVIARIYGTRHTQFHPRRAANYPYRPPTPVIDDFAISPKGESPTIFKLPHTPTFTTHALHNMLSYIRLKYEPLLLAITDDHTYHPRICNTRSKNIGDLLISSKYNYDIPK